MSTIPNPTRTRRRRLLLMTTIVVAVCWLVIANARSVTTIATTPVPDASPLTFGLALVADGFERPVYVADPGDGSGRLVVVEQAGRLRIVRDGVVEAEPLLDITERVGCCGERGLLSVAFHPDFAANGLLFVNYTDREGDTNIERLRVAADDPDRVDPTSAETILFVEQPASNHNGGLLLFGPDGFLYIGLGDGGGGNGRNSQRLDTLLGKMLRIDIDRAENGLPYAIPADNPFAGRADARPEIWALGLRNPWRYGFDRETGDLWIGDVGSSHYEEVNLIPAGSGGGQNFGWNRTEGPDCRDSDGCDGLVAPVSGFGRDDGCVVTGGMVYRGEAIPALQGVYLFADYCGGNVWGLTPGGEGWRVTRPVATGLSVSSFGEDAAGELYLVDLGGGVYRLTNS